MRPANGRATSSRPDTLYRLSADRVNGRVLRNLVTGRLRETTCAGATPNAPVNLFPVGSEGNLPRPAPRQRPGPAFGLVLLGDPPSLKDVSDPHGCVKPQRCSCRAVACGDRGVSCDMGPATSCSATMASRHGFFHRMSEDASPVTATASLATTGPASIKDSACPVVPRELSEGLAKPPSCRVWMSVPPVKMAAASRRSAPRRLRIRRHDESVPMPVHLPGLLQNALPFRIWHLDVDSRKLRLPRPCRISAGCLVSQSVGVPSDHASIEGALIWPRG